MPKPAKIWWTVMTILALVWPVTAQEGPDVEKCEIEGRSSRQLRFLGHNLKLPGHKTSLAEEFMVKADEPELEVLARSFGKTLTWSRQETRLTSSNGVSLALKQTRLPDEDQGRILPLAPQVVEGAVHIPISSLEELLDVRLTFRDDVVFVEPIIRSVELEGEGPDLKLVVQSTGTVSYKTFPLKEPDRFVIDIAGAVLDTPRLKLEHPEVGTVRLGQFELGPATSRIVIPTDVAVMVQPEKGGRARDFEFALRLPQKKTQPVVKATPAAQDEPLVATKGQKTIKEVRLLPLKGGQRIELLCDGPIKYQWSRLLPPDNRFFIDIPNAILLGKKKTLEINDAFLGQVRISQFQPQPDPVVRLVVDFKKPGELRMVTGEGENDLALEILHRRINPKYAVLKGYGTTAYPAAGSTICLDAGHGGSDPGAINRGLGVSEKQVTLDITKRLARILESQGWNVIMTRKDDRDVSYAGSSAKEELGARAQVANGYKADLFVSIHCNASTNPGSNGTSLHYYKRSDYVLARSLEGSVMAGTGRINRGLRKNRFYVLSHTRMPAVLVETAFLTNSHEGKLLSTPAYRERIAQSIAEGLRGYAMNHLNWRAAGR